MARQLLTAVLLNGGDTGAPLTVSSMTNFLNTYLHHDLKIQADESISSVRPLVDQLLDYGLMDADRRSQSSNFKSDHVSV